LNSCLKNNSFFTQNLVGLEATLSALPSGAEKFKDVSLPSCLKDLHNYEIAYVTRVIDGDSIQVLVDGKEEEVRYIGINAPEYYSHERKAAEAATRKNQELVEKQYVLLIKDVSERDKFGRLLRYVITADGFVNYELVKSGMAVVKEYPPDTACHQYFAPVAQ